jgi:hypothetical protein
MGRLAEGEIPKALSAFLQRLDQRLRPLPVGSRLMIAR